MDASRPRRGRPGHPDMDLKDLAARAKSALGKGWLGRVAKELGAAESTVGYWFRVGRAPPELRTAVEKLERPARAWAAMKAHGRDGTQRGPVLVACRDDWTLDVVTAALAAAGIAHRVMDVRAILRPKREPGDDL